MIFQFVFLKTYILYTITVSLWIASHTMRDWLPWVQTDFQRLTSRWFQFTDYCNFFLFFLTFRFWFDSTDSTFSIPQFIHFPNFNFKKIPCRFYFWINPLDYFWWVLCISKLFLNTYLYWNSSMYSKREWMLMHFECSKKRNSNVFLKR